jgi:hypothetical protein
MEFSSPFHIVWHEKELEVIPKKVGGDWVYLVRFPDRTPILMLTHATKEKGGHFWTSVPEGRQGEAEQIGPMITAYYKVSATK